MGAERRCYLMQCKFHQQDKPLCGEPERKCIVQESDTCVMVVLDMACRLQLGVAPDVATSKKLNPGVVLSDSETGAMVSFAIAKTNKRLAFTLLHKPLSNAGAGTHIADLISQIKISQVCMDDLQKYICDGEFKEALFEGLKPEKIS